MRRTVVITLLALVAVLSASAQHTAAIDPMKPGPGGPRGAPPPAPRPRPPAPPVARSTRTSLDYALPALTDEERKLALLSGYVCTQWPTEFLFRGQSIDEVPFMRVVGFGDYADKLATFRKRRRAWGWGTLISGLGTVALLPLALSTDDGSSVATAAAAALGLGFVVTSTGAAVTSARQPARPDFQAVAYRANDLNRGLMAK